MALTTVNATLSPIYRLCAVVDWCRVCESTGCFMVASLSWLSRSRCLMELFHHTLSSQTTSSISFIAYSHLHTQPEQWKMSASPREVTVRDESRLWLQLIAQVQVMQWPDHRAVSKHMDLLIFSNSSVSHTRVIAVVTLLLSYSGSDINIK